LNLIYGYKFVLAIKSYTDNYPNKELVSQSPKIELYVSETTETNTLSIKLISASVENENPEITKVELTPKTGDLFDLTLTISLAYFVENSELKVSLFAKNITDNSLEEIMQNNITINYDNVSDNQLVKTFTDINFANSTVYNNLSDADTLQTVLKVESVTNDYDTTLENYGISSINASPVITKLEPLTNVSIEENNDDYNKKCEITATLTLNQNVNIKSYSITSEQNLTLDINQSANKITYLRTKDEIFSDNWILLINSEVSSETISSKYKIQVISSDASLANCL
jgi:hypothetical protein